jgi:putative FmdB family regulatory protein
MPTYAYRCKSCSHEFEEFQKISDDTLKICPSCKKHTLIRIIGGGAGLVFKGSGFYQTDYKKSSDESKTKTATKKETKTESKPSETKPSTKSETNTSKDK